MIFNSFEFLLLFFPATVLAFCLGRANRVRVGALLFASLLFYGFSGAEQLAVLVLGIVWVYVITGLSEFRRRPVYLFASVIGPLGALFYYKYYDFFAAAVTGTGGPDGVYRGILTDVAVPAGISFFTFQLVAFAVDRFRGEIPDQPKASHFALYISFFPQLVAGPIVRFQNVRDYIKALGDVRLHKARVQKALTLLLMGLATKVLIADLISHQITPLIGSPGDLHPVTAVYLLFAFGFQIYFDFYGYSLMAIGLGHLFGIELPTNFRRPFSAKNPVDLWTRWHITLMSFFIDYVYTPLATRLVRSSVRRADGPAVRFLATVATPVFVVFMLSGLWHGAGWNWVLWGVYQSVWMVLYRLAERPWSRLPSAIQVAATYTIFTLSWSLVIFDLESAAALFGNFATHWGVRDLPGVEMVLAIALAAAVSVWVRPEALAEDAAAAARVNWLRTAVMAALAAGVLWYLDRSQSFIYFRF